LVHLKTNENILKQEKINEIINKNLIIDLNGKIFLKNYEKNQQSLLYNEKDIEEDIELLDLFYIKDDNENGSSEHF
jgi:hypothetical protein